MNGDKNHTAHCFVSFNLFTMRTIDNRTLQNIKTTPLIQTCLNIPLCYMIVSYINAKIGFKLDQIGPKWDKSGTFRMTFQFILADRHGLYHWEG